MTTVRRFVGAGVCLHRSQMPTASADVSPKPEPPAAAILDPDRSKTKPEWPKRVVAPSGAPNVVLILLDDVGFGASSAVGGPVATPALDKLASEGLRYNQFHVNALCSPTRASLLSGRNAHKVGLEQLRRSRAATLATTRTGRSSAASVADILRRKWVFDRGLRQVA